MHACMINCRRWKLNLKKLVKDKDASSEIYQTLHILMTESDPEEFQLNLERFEGKWDSTYPEFIAYFRTYYSKRAGTRYCCVFSYCIAKLDGELV